MNADAALRRPLLVALVPLALVAALGCLAGETPQSTLSEADGEPVDTSLEAFSSWTTSASWNLSDVPEGADWILVQAIPEENASFGADVDAELVFEAGTRSGDSPQHGACVGAWLKSAGHPAFLGSNPNGALLWGHEAGAEVGGTEERRGARPATGTQVVGGALGASGEAGERVPFLVGVDEAGYWADREDSTLQATLEADTRFKWRIDEAGTFTCGYGVDDLDGGRVVHGPAGTIAEDRFVERTLEGPGYAWVRGQADVAHAVSVSTNGSQAWSSSWSAAEAPTGAANASAQHFFEPVAPLPPGDLRLSVDRFEGVDSAWLHYAIFEVPPWAEAILHPERSIAVGNG